jgi:hypothetical protein
MPFIVAGLAIVGLATVYTGALTAPSAGGYHDDGVYAVTAKALAEGRGYRIVSLPDAPPQTKYPILFPFLLSLVWRVHTEFPANLPYLRAVPFVAGLGWLWCSWLLVTRAGMPRTAATVLVLISAASPWILFLSTSLMSETLFALLMTVTILLVHKTLESQRPSGLAWVAGALAGACLLTRAIGVTVIVAGLLCFAGRRRWIDLVRFVAAAVLVGAPWVIWVVAQSPATVPSEPFYTATNYGAWNVFSGYSLEEKLIIIKGNAILLLIAPLQLLGIDIFGSTLLLSVGVAMVLARGVWVRRSHPITIFVAVYLAVLLGWAWPPIRFVTVVMPLLGWLFWSALPDNWPGLRQAVAAALVMAVAPTAIRGPASIRSHGASWPVMPSGEDWSRSAQLLDWLRVNTPSNSVIAGNLDPMYFLYTGRRAIRAFETDAYQLYYRNQARSRPIGTAETLRARMLTHRVDFLVVTPNLGFGEAPHFRSVVDELAHTRSGSLVPATDEPTRGYVVYRIDRSKLGLNTEDRKGP